MGIKIDENLCLGEITTAIRVVGGKARALRGFGYQQKGRLLYVKKGSFEIKS